MLNNLRNNLFVRVLWGFLGLFLLNVSVDSPDPEPNHLPEDLSFNDQESIIEIVLEQLLGYDDAIVEYDDHDTEEHNKKKSVRIDLISGGGPSHGPNAWCIEALKKIHQQTAYFTSVCIELDSPPPEA